MELEGQIIDIIYQNEINSYTIATFELEDEEITIVGYLPFIVSGDTLKITGKYVEHKDYGRQFKIDTFEKLMPKTLDALERYLGSGNIKGIGPVTAKKIVERFKEETIDILRTKPEKLSLISGITYSKAIEYGEQFNENWDLWQIVSFLEKFGIGANNAKRIYKALGKNAVEEIRKNPYVLVDIVYAVDFKQIDKMALDIGIEAKNEERIKSGIKYSLVLVSYNGHTCVLKENLIKFVSDLLKVEEELIEDELINLKVKEEIVEEKQNENTWIYLKAFHQAEINIASKLVLLDSAKNIKRINHVEKEIKEIEKKSNIELSDKQKEAIKAVNEKNVCIITGGPGTGKTTVIKSIIDLFNIKKNKVVLCAPTGRAAKRMTETTGVEAKTLHRLLEIGKVQDEGQIADVDLSITPIDADVIIVDEVSMVDVFLMNYLLRGIYLGTKLILVGDVDQLPSVGPGSVLKDIILSEKITTIHLDKIFRQAAKSKIILNAHRVNLGQEFVKKEEIEDELIEDFFFIKEPNQDKIQNNILSLCSERLQNYGNYDFFKNIQVITPTKKGMNGTKELNKELQNLLNPKSPDKKEKISGQTIFRIGDKVMQVKNNYDILWEKNGIKSETGSGVFNGELGIVEEIDNSVGSLKVKFDDDKEAWYEYSELEQLEHSYAITVHKSQGSEFDVVILPIVQSSPMLLTRNLLYTAITRAKKLLIIVGNPNILNFMIQNADSKIRNTGLKYKLENL